MRIEWVNHASFIVDTCLEQASSAENQRPGATTAERVLPPKESAGIGSDQREGLRLICDPWIEGAAFNNGWLHLSPTSYSYEAFENITHIWFSHEHPDHFSPPNLLKIPQEYRRRITVLFHLTKDKRVIKVCEKLGFKTQELPEEEWVQVGNAKVVCGRNGQFDSWLGIECGYKLLNMNDCVYESDKDLIHISELFGSTDVLFTQFSYANWVGNKSDRISQRRAAEDKREEMRKQARIFKPRWIVPFASFIWFAHQENYYMNEEVNRIGDICGFCQQTLKTEPLVFYPGDWWQVGEEHNPSPALRSYESDYTGIVERPRLLSSLPVSDDNMREFAASFAIKLRQQNNGLLLRLMPPATAYLTDKCQTAIVSCLSLKLLPGRQGKIDIEMGSDSLAYCFRYGWGSDTLQVNGRYQVPPAGNPRAFFRIFRVAGLNTADEHLDALFVAKKIAHVALRNTIASSRD